jgi:hypothetical protein
VSRGRKRKQTMTKAEATKVLEAVADRASSGYAADLARDFVSNAPNVGSQMEDRDADALFRTLVLDEGWDVDEASEAYEAATELLGDGE